MFVRQSLNLWGGITEVLIHITAVVLPSVAVEAGLVSKVKVLIVELLRSVPRR